MSKKKQFAILGLGRFGSHVALMLEEMGCEVLGVDRNEDIAASLADRLTRVVSFDARNARALREAGIANFDTVVIASKDLETSLMATMLCKEMDVGEIIVKAIDERHAEMARRLGASNIIFSERDTARRVAVSLASSNAANYTEIDANINVLSIPAPPWLIGKNLSEANLQAAYNVNVIAIVAKDETFLIPPPNRAFVEGDKIFVIGKHEALAKLERSIDE